MFTYCKDTDLLILYTLDSIDLYNMSQTCKYFNKLIDEKFFKNKIIKDYFHLFYNDLDLLNKYPKSSWRNLHDKISKLLPYIEIPLDHFDRTVIENMKISEILRLHYYAEDGCCDDNGDDLYLDIVYVGNSNFMFTKGYQADFLSLEKAVDDVFRQKNYEAPCRFIFKTLNPYMFSGLSDEKYTFFANNQQINFSFKDQVKHIKTLKTI